MIHRKQASQPIAAPSPPGGAEPNEGPPGPAAVEVSYGMALAERRDPHTKRCGQRRDEVSPTRNPI
ncbi:MAG TPA: hypothetical protein VMF89_33095, partial [Polyangiales bacterium]|nr:hypothetical protein [Polyangiales bacterium]